MDVFTVATWNVNSINARVPRVLEFIELHQPDVLLLQETKVQDDAFPAEPFQAAGYRVADYGCGQWTGVAILAREDHDIVDVVRGLPGEPLPEEARWIEATVGGLRVASVYVINGRDVSDPMFAHKLDMLEAMARRCGELTGRPLVVAGDFNIAPTDRDVWDREAYEGSTHVTEEERGRLARILDTGLLDAYRHVEPEEQQFTWWDYRGGAFHRGFGLRIDLALVTPDLAARVRTCGIDRDFRKGSKPSDHAPLLVTIGSAPQVG